MSEKLQESLRGLDEERLMLFFRVARGKFKKEFGINDVSNTGGDGKKPPALNIYVRSREPHRDDGEGFQSYLDQALVEIEQGTVVTPEMGQAGWVQIPGKVGQDLADSLRMARSVELNPRAAVITYQAGGIVSNLHLNFHVALR